MSKKLTTVCMLAITLATVWQAYIRYDAWCRTAITLTQFAKMPPEMRAQLDGYWVTWAIPSGELDWNETWYSRDATSGRVLIWPTGWRQGKRQPALTPGLYRVTGWLRSGAGGEVNVSSGQVQWVGPEPAPPVAVENPH